MYIYLSRYKGMVVTLDFSVCMYVCMYVCVCRGIMALLSPWISLCVLYMYVCVCVSSLKPDGHLHRAYKKLHAQVDSSIIQNLELLSPWISLCVLCMYVCVCVYIYIYIYIYILSKYKGIVVTLDFSGCMYVCMCVFIYIYVHVIKI